MRPLLRILGLSCAAASAWAVLAVAAPMVRPPSLFVAPRTAIEAEVPVAPEVRVYRRYRTHPVATRKPSPQAFKAARRSQPVPAPRRHHTAPVR